MTFRYITLGDCRKIGLGAYVRAWKECLRLVREGQGQTNIGRGVDGAYDQTAEEALRLMRQGMDDRIDIRAANQRPQLWAKEERLRLKFHIRHQKMRKWAWDWQRDAKQLAWKLNNRIMIDWMRPEFKPRFANRLREMEDA